MLVAPASAAAAVAIRATLGVASRASLTVASRATLVAALAALAACGDDAPRDPPSLGGYAMPTPRPIGPLTAVPLDAAAFDIEARGVRYTRNGTVLRARDLRLRGVRAVGDERSATLLPVQLVVDMPERPPFSGTVAGHARTDGRGVLRLDGTLALGASDVGFDATVQPAGRWTATLRLAPLALADAHGFLGEIPPHGLARGVLSLSGSNGELHARTERLVLGTADSEIRLAGAVTRSSSGRLVFDEVRIDLDPVQPDDWHAWFGSDPPLEAPLTGHLTAHGDARNGIAVDGRVVAEDSAGSRLAADVSGRVWLDPRPRLEVAVRSRSLRLAGTGPLDLDIRLGGDADSLAVAGSARLGNLDSIDALHPLLVELPAAVATQLRGASLEVDAHVVREADARRVSGIATVVDSTGRVLVVLEGSAPIGDAAASGGITPGENAIDLTARLDSLPLSLLPTPPGIGSLGGFARLRIRLAGDRIELLDVRAVHRDGSLTLTGGVDLVSPLDLRDAAAAFDGARVDVSALLDTTTIVDMDSARAVVAGRFEVTGALERPHVTGALEVLEGFAYEGKLAPDPPLDPDDAPYSDLLADAPWPSTPLRERAIAAAADERHQEALPFTADITATVTPDFRVVDEDSDLGVQGDVHLVVDRRGTYAVGDARIVDGFYAYYGELFQMAGGTFSVDGGATKLAMAGVLREADRSLGTGQGGHAGIARRDPPIGIFGYSTPATVLELLRRRSSVPATQPELASLLLFGVPLQPIDSWDHALLWRGDSPADLVGQRSAVQGAGLAWSYLADELYDWVPLDEAYLRAHTTRIGSRYPGWLMLGTQLEAGVHLGSRLTARTTQVVGAGAWPGIGIRFALREQAMDPATRHLELFDEPRFSAGSGTGGSGTDVTVRRRTGIRIRWLWDY